MEEIKALVSAIREWNETRNTEINGLVILLRRLLQKLGAEIGLEDDEDYLLNNLQERIVYLAESEGMGVDFLVISMVNAITELLEGTVRNHGEALVVNEQALQQLKENSEEAETVRAKVNKLKDENYKRDATRELALWNRIAAEKFSIARREAWKDQALKETTEKLLADWKETPQEVREALSDVPFAVIRESISPSDIKDIDPEEARQIREQWLNNKED